MRDEFLRQLDSLIISYKPVSGNQVFCLRELVSVLHSVAKLRGAADVALQPRASGKPAANKATTPPIVPWLVSALTDRLKVEPAVPQGVSNSLWALAALGYYDAPLITAFINHAGDPDCLAAFKPQELSNSLWALSKLSYSHAPFFDACVARALEPGFLAAFKPQELSNFLYALSSVGHCNTTFVRAWLRQLNCSVVSGFNVQELCTSLWSLAVWCAMTPEAERAAFGTAVGEAAATLLGRLQSLFDADPDIISPEGYRQLFQVFDVLPCGAALRGRHPALAQRCCEDFMAQTKCNRMQFLNALNATDSQGQVLDAALALGYDGAKLEVLTRDNAMCVDVDLGVVLPDGRRVALEFDGPSHYSRNQPYKLNGATHLRNSMLERRGYVVVGIPYFEFYFISKEAQREYLKDRMTRKGIAP